MSTQPKGPVVYKPSVSKYGVSYAPQPATPFVPHAAKTTVTIPGGIPTIEISDRAYHDMLYLVDIVPVEVGWLGTVTVDGNVYRIEEVFVFDQEVHGTQCELSENGIAEWATNELLTQPNGVDLMNRLRFWGHSHGMMGTTPSGQDDSQVEEFRGDCDFFIRGIFNKKGEARFDVYRFDLNLTFLDVSWKRAFERDDSRHKELEDQVRERVREQRYHYRAPTRRQVVSPQFGQHAAQTPREIMDEEVGFEGFLAHMCEKQGVTVDQLDGDDVRMVRQAYFGGSTKDMEDVDHD